MNHPCCQDLTGFADCGRASNFRSLHYAGLLSRVHGKVEQYEAAFRRSCKRTGKKTDSLQTLPSL